jgi:HlyD family secretion protein
LKIIAKQGEMISANTPVILLESKRYYYDIYLSEKQAAQLKEGDSIVGTTVANDRKIAGTIRFITQAPGFADLKMSREKGQSDLSAFQVRIYADAGQGAIPGMTIEVRDNEFDKG